MIEIFGFEMREVLRPPQRVKDRALVSASDGRPHYILLSCVPSGLYSKVVRDASKDADKGLAMVILASIEISGGKLNDEDLWTHLKDVGVDPNIEHPLFGKPALVLEELVKKRYINLERQSGPDGEIKTYSIGEVAAAEIGTEQIKEFYLHELAEGGNN